MPKYYDKLLRKLQKRPLSQNEFSSLLYELGGLLAEPQIELEIIKTSGIPLLFAHNKVYLRTTLTPYLQESFCIVDIETNGHNPYIHQPIEIGAIHYQDGEIKETFHSFIFCQNIPQKITEITGITNSMLQDAPKIHQVLESFKLFLKDSIFVAHNVDFDFNFLSNACYYNHFGYLYNPRLCTIKLAQKTLQSPKYSLGFLNDFLGIHHHTLHRALEDSKITLEVFKKCLKQLDKNIYTSYDLLKFTNSKSILQGNLNEN